MPSQVSRKEYASHKRSRKQERHRRSNSWKDSEKSSSENVRPRDSKRDRYRRVDISDSDRRDERSESEEREPPNFDFWLFIEEEHKKYLTKKFLRSLQDIQKVDKIYFDNKLVVPDINGGVLRICGKKLRYKDKAVVKILRRIEDEVEMNSSMKQYKESKNLS